MKNSIKQLFAGLLAVVALVSVSCTNDEFTRTAGRQPDEAGMSGISADLYRPGRIDTRALLSKNQVTDILHCRLSQPTKNVLDLLVKVDPEKLAAYNAAHQTTLTLFPADKVTLFYESSIAAEKKESGDIKVTFEREGVEKGRYLLPVTAEVKEPGASQVLTTTFYYDVHVLEAVPESQIDDWNFKVVAYVNTEEMQPMIATKFYVTAVDLLNDIWADKTWVDIVALRKATIVQSGGHVSLELGADLQYVLDKREQYVVPVQKLGRKVLICINGGFRNLTDPQIADLVYKIKYVIDKFQIDGVNFFEMDATYGNGVPAPNVASYAKLIKATKEALGDDKLVTLACDAETTDELSVAQNGVEAGRYIDYAWSGIFDKVIDPYTGSSELKPVAGLDRSKYGASMQKTHDTAWLGQNWEAASLELRALYRQNSESANVFAFWDMPPSRSGIESGAGSTFEILLVGMMDENMEYDFMLYLVMMNPDAGGTYGLFSKDW